MKTRQRAHRVLISAALCFATLAGTSIADELPSADELQSAEHALITTMPAGLNPAMMEGFKPPHVTAEGGDRTKSVKSCGPIIDRYPIAGPHNNGYDANWWSWNCSTANSGSDFIAGSHLGNDIFGALGTPVVAAQAGTIKWSFSDPTGGNVVYIEDNCGWWHYYAHLDSVDPGLFIGKYVEVGTRLGTLGNTGSASGTAVHLHYSVYPGTYSQGVDPHPYLYAKENGSCSSGNASSCLNGINVDGFNIAVTDTDTGHRVCGVHQELFQCNGSNWWKVSNSCNGSSCSCPYGKFKNGREIPEHMTHCGFRVCGMSNTFWDCTSSGWSNTNIGCS